MSEPTSTPTPYPDPLARQQAIARTTLALALLASPFLSHSSALITVCVFATLLLTTHWWIRWAYIPPVPDPPRIGRPTSKLSIIFLIIALLLASYLRLRLINSTEAFSSIRFSLPAGLTSVFLAWRLLHWFGFRCAALFAAFFITIHPAFIHYSTISSHQSLSLFFQFLAITSIYLALRTLTWHYWIVYAASISLCLHFHPGSAFFAFTTSLFLTAYLTRKAWKTKTRAAAIPLLTRFLIVSIVSFLTLFQATKPSVLKEIEFLKTHHPISTPPINSLTSAWHHTIAGSTNQPALPILVLSPLILAFGTLKVIRSNRYAAPLMLAAVSAPILSYLSFPQHLSLPHWNLSFFLPGFILLFSIGITSLSDLFRNKRIRPLATFAIGTSYLILFAILTPSNQPVPNIRQNTPPTPLSSD